MILKSRRVATDDLAECQDNPVDNAQAAAQRVEQWRRSHVLDL
jgi:hypothetical protein